MNLHERFHYASLDELKSDIRRQALEIPVAASTKALLQPLQIGPVLLPNRMGVHPMEGCDGTIEGRPGELTIRRYLRFAKGGAGLLWFEATAVAPEGRANPRQLWLHKESAAAFSAMLKQSLAAGREANGKEYRPFTVLQLTHSGRYSKPAGTAEPIVAGLNPWLDVLPPEKIRVISDDQLEALEEKFVEAAVLAAEIGFDAVDVKCCHGYLAAELLSAFDRPGNYGGSFENRTRFVRNVVAKIRTRLKHEIQVAVRMNAYDSVPYPYGWGVDRSDFRRPDFSEPVRFAQLLADAGVSLINVTCGNPYYNPHINRPYDVGNYIPPFHPLEGVATLLAAAKSIQAAIPEQAVMATGFSWLRQWGPFAAAAGVADGWFKIAGFGRQSFAYPDLARDIVLEGRLRPDKVCIACSKCTAIMRDGGTTGCVIRDSQVYGPIYREGRQGKPAFESTQAAENNLGR